MKILSGTISTLLSLAALYCFLTAKSTTYLWMGLVATLASIIFICYMIMEEQKEEVERLRKKIMKHGLY